jgi:hypothetical protein
MFSTVQKFVIATLVTAVTMTPWTLATSYVYMGDDTGVVVVGFNASQDTALSLDAARLFDARDLIRLEYGAVKLDTLLRVKQITAPEGIAVNLDDSSISVQNDSNELNIVLAVSNDHAETGGFQVVVTLENAETGATTSVTLMVRVQ